MSRKFILMFSILVLVSLALAACQQASGPAPVETVIVTVEVPAAGPAVPAGQGETLNTVKARGNIICGGNANVPGFGFLDEAGNFTGFDIDYCKAMAAAIFGDATAFEIRPLTSAERFSALQSGEIDVLIRNTTWTLTRDSSEVAGNFTHTTFYDGQGFIVRIADNINTLEDMEGGTICVQTGTTTEANLADTMAARGISYTPVVFEDVEVGWQNYEEGRCDSYTTDKSGLVSRQTLLTVPSDHVILDETISKEPLGPMVRHGDDQWFDIAQWVVFTTFYAEEAGITSANVDDIRASSTSPRVISLLGGEGELGAKLGLDNDWAYNVIKQVGNYAEIYDRNLGPDTLTYIPRGLNSLYLDGGLLYAPPFR